LARARAATPHELSDDRSIRERPAVQTFLRALGGGVVGESQEHETDVLRVKRLA
jgi:hypothetical protein